MGLCPRLCLVSTAFQGLLPILSAPRLRYIIIHMAAPIVYNGVEPQDDAGVGNRSLLFQGLKFWVGRMVPFRNTFLSHIEVSNSKGSPLMTKVSLADLPL